MYKKQGMENFEENIYRRFVFYCCALSFYLARLRHFKLKLSVWQFLALGYLAVIILGSLLLVLPFAAKDGQPTRYTAGHDKSFSLVLPYVLFNH